MNSIKLIDLVKELSLYKGDASTNSSSDLFKDIINDIIPNKDSFYINDYDAIDNSINEKIPVSTFIKDISRFIVSEQGSNKLIAKKYGSSTIETFLINTKAPSLDLAVIGKMTLDKYEAKGSKFPTIYQVSWSNIADEYLRSDFGKLMYFLVYDYITSLGALMSSDSTLFSGSFRMWTQFMPSIVPYFGIILTDIIIPVSKDDINNLSDITSKRIDGIVGMKKYPPSMDKINKATAGLSWVNGDYGILDLDDARVSINDKGFYIDGKDVNFIQTLKYANDQGWSLKKYIKYLNSEYIGNLIGNNKKIKNLQCLIVSFTNAIMVVKEENGRLISTPI